MAAPKVIKDGGRSNGGCAPKNGSSGVIATAIRGPVKGPVAFDQGVLSARQATLGTSSSRFSVESCKTVSFPSTVILKTVPWLLSFPPCGEVP